MLRRAKSLSSDADYRAAYGSTGQQPKSVSGLNDRKLAHSAQMFHYQHQKQQMLQLERSAAAANVCSIGTFVFCTA